MKTIQTSVKRLRQWRRYVNALNEKTGPYSERPALLLPPITLPREVFHRTIHRLSIPQFCPTDTEAWLGREGRIISEIMLNMAFAAVLMVRSSCVALLLE